MDAHATRLPYFRYLVSNPARGFVLGRDQAVPVMLPDPARFALHRLVTSTLRPGSQAPSKTTTGARRQY
nr:GSU2403 family nucleotidyltransferase fold protein [Paraburkholderia caribensis]